MSVWSRQPLPENECGRVRMTVTLVRDLLWLSQTAEFRVPVCCKWVRDGPVLGGHSRVQIWGGQRFE